MNTIHPKKSTRILLSFTAQEREELTQCHLKSHLASESDYVRKALEIYADLHRRVVAGADILLQHAEKGPRYLPVAKFWDRDLMPPPDASSPRRNFELKTDSSFKELVDKLVSAGAAPSLTALARSAIGVYSAILSKEQQGFILMEEVGGKRSVIDFPPATEWNIGTDGVAAYSGVLTGFTQLPTKNILQVLDEEKALHPRVMYIDAPDLTPERDRDVALKVAETVVSNLLFGTTYVYILDGEKDRDTLFQWVRDVIAPRVRWDDLAPDQKQRVEDIRKHSGGNPCDEKHPSPAWYLIRKALFALPEIPGQKQSSNSQSSLQPVIIDRMFDTARWYAEMNDGRLWGYQFVSTSKQEDPERTFLRPMHEDTIREQILRLRTYGDSQVLVPRTLAGNIVPFPVCGSDGLHPAKVGQRPREQHKNKAG